MSGTFRVTARKLQVSIQRLSIFHLVSQIPFPNGHFTDPWNYRDESEITSVYAASVEDVDKAVAAARKAFKDPSWRDISGTKRGDLLFKLSELVEREKETLATIETWDNGLLPPPPHDHNRD